jgi:hypothetical protein
MSTLIRIAVGQLFKAGGAPLRVGTYVAGEAPGALTTTMALRDVVNTHAKTIVVFQRTAGTENLATPTGRVPVMFDYTGPIPVNPEVRVTNAQGSEVMGWTRLTGVMEVTPGVGIGVLEPVPQGMTYTIAGLRDGDQPNKAETSSSGTGKWGVGVRGVWGGQSNMNSIMNAGVYNVDKVPGSTQYEYQYWDSAKVPGYYYETKGWAGPNYNSGSVEPGRVAWLRILTAKLKARYGVDVPVAMTNWAFDSTGIVAFLGPSGARWTTLMQSGATGTTYGLGSPANYSGTGDFEFMVWHQGESDNSNTSRAQYLAYMKELYQDLLNHVGQFGRTAANFGFFPAVLGVYGATNVEHLRGAVMDFEAYAIEANRWPKARIAMSSIDLDTSDPNDGNGDTLHIGTPYAYWGNRRFLQTVLHFLGCATYSARGPQISAVARSGNSVIVTVTHGRAGATLVNKKGTALTGWYANTAQDFSGTDVTVTAAITGTNQVTLTLPAGTGAVWIKHAGHKLGSALSIHPDVSNLVYDDSPYTEGATGTDLYTGFPLMATPDAWAA